MAGDVDMIATADDLNAPIFNIQREENEKKFSKTGLASSTIQIAKVNESIEMIE